MGECEICGILEEEGEEYSGVMLDYFREGRGEKKRKMVKWVGGDEKRGNE